MPRPTRQIRQPVTPSSCSSSLGETRRSSQDPETSHMALDETRSVDYRHTADFKMTEVSRAQNAAALDDIEQLGEGQDRDVREGRRH